MTPRERVLAALAHQEPDRTPCDFWAEPPTWNRLFAQAGHSDKDRILDELGVDVRHLEAGAPPELRLCGPTQKRDLDASSECTSAEGISLSSLGGEGGGEEAVPFAPLQSSRIGAASSSWPGALFQNFWGERYVYNQTPWGPMREDVKGALSGAQSLAELESFSWPSPDCLDRSTLQQQCRRHERHALLYGFADIWQRPALVRGWEEFFVDMAERPEWAHYLCRRFTDFYREDYTRAAELTHGRIDLYLLISDLGSQRGPLISRRMFEAFVAPYIREMADCIHGLGGRVLFHSCGNIAPLIPELIRLGVDVLDPVQPAGAAMQPEQLKAAFGDRLCFHGGLDMQHLLPRGTPEQVAATARRYCETLGRGGGYILGPAHLFQPEVPPENIFAVYQAVGQV